MRDTKGDQTPGASKGRTEAGSNAVTTLPTVGIGASAGGLEALKQLFAQLPDDTGMAFVVVQHLDPDRPSLLTNVLGTATPMQVVTVTDDMRVESNRVHVIPSGSDLSIHQGALSLLPRQKSGKLHLPIDSFFRALAEDQRSRAIGVVLSGSGADGTEGLRAIKSEGGIAIAQDPESAQFRSMPDSAIAAGVVDYRLRPEEMAKELVRLSRHPYVVKGAPEEVPGAAGAGADQDQAFASMLALVRKATGIDFGGYKRTTVMRRVERRMALRRIRTLGEYVGSLREDPDEARSLASDTLIPVTSFFRDPAAFEALQARVFPEILEHKENGAPIRIWVAGCSTGEEAYSVAISLFEFIEGRKQDRSVKLFGTDLSDEVVARARVGLYPESALRDVSPERLSRFFEHAEGGYRIVKRVRDSCVFVKHDLASDPPFARLDLLSCRNVLIYFDAELQRRVIPMLHYCLGKPGYLLLGQSESITGFPDLFSPVDKEHRIYAKKGESTRIAYPLAAGREAEADLWRGAPTERRQPAREAQRQADHLLLTRYAPPAVIVNERLEVIQFRGHTGAFFEPPPGQPQTSVIRMAREGLVAQLHEALERAKAESVTVRKEGLRIPDEVRTRVVDLEVVPLAGIGDSPERFFLLLFEEVGPPRPDGAPARPPATPGALPQLDAEEARRLRTELDATKDYLQAVISEQQSTTDELAAANEELIAANEELQSTNEELQSAKEELQSTNEELTTVNDQLRSRNQELDVVAADLVNVLEAADLPIIIVDAELRVRRFTPTARDISSLIPGDVGRPLDDLKLKVRVDDLAERVREVIRGMAPREWEVQGQEGRWFRLQIRPYRAADHRLDGAVLSFIDVDLIKRALTEAEAARDYARRIVETVPTALVVLGADLRVVSTNPRFRSWFALSADEIEGKSFFALGAGVWNLPSVRQAIEVAWESDAPLAALELAGDFPGIGRRVLSVAGRRIAWTGGVPMLLLAIEDTTARRAFEEERAQLLASEKQARLESERANKTKDLFLATLSHELRTPLSVMTMQSQILKRAAPPDSPLARSSAAIERAAASQAKLIDDLLDISRVTSGKLLLDFGPVDLKAVVRSGLDLVRGAAEAKSIRIEDVIDDSAGFVYGDSARLQQVVANLLTNAIKFTPQGGRVSVRLERTGEHVQITVADSGMGIRPEVLPQLFNRFVQADSTVTRTHGGLGLGLAIVRHLVELHGGQVHAESAGEGKGSTFRVTLWAGPSRDPTAVPATRQAVGDIAGVRLLLVEDDDDTREAYTTILAQLGVDVRAAPSAAAGLSLLEGFHPQVVLCDVAMPGEDGYTFIQKVRRLPPERGGQTPAAALTALASELDRRRALEAGFQMHIAKPADASRLAAAVGRLAAWKPVPGGPRDGDLGR